ncbi:Ig-like domain-containing protein [Cohnella sp. GCM10012308]|uniref:Ig-like domain-containing protein n=1 Tax=Cohnella sp. GCM10012308 TaxID=3317329 RepID=UPI003609D7E3
MHLMMKKLLLYVLLLALLIPGGITLTLPTARAIAANDNLVSNGSFEVYDDPNLGGWTARKANGWSIWTDASLTPVAPAVTVELYHAAPGAGSRSLKISSAAPNKSRITVNQGGIAVVPGQEYRLSGAFKTSQIVGASNAYGVNLRVAYLNAAGQALQTDYLVNASTPVRGNNADFKSYARSTTAPSGAVSARIDVDFNQVSGSAWFDDIQFRPWTSLKGISFADDGSLLQPGGVKAAPILLQPADTSETGIVWTSSNPAVATVDAAGSISGVSPGLASIQAASPDGSASGIYPVVVTQAGLLANGGFETVSAGSGNGFTGLQASAWSATASYGSPVVTVSDAVYGAGGHALSIGAAANAKASVAQRNIVVSGGSWYRLSGLIRTDGLSGAGASLRLAWNGAGGSVLGTVYGPAAPVKGTTQGWREIGDLFQAPANAVRASVYAYYDTGYGQAWYDELQLTPWVPVASLSPAGASFRSLAPGESQTLSAIFAPTGATDRRIVWQSSVPSVATVDQNGRVTAVAAGHAVVSAVSIEGAKRVDSRIDVTGFKNGGFEKTTAASGGWVGSRPTDWSSYFTPAGATNPQLTVDTAVKKEGANAIRFQAASAGKAVVFHLIEGAAPGLSYKVGGWLKTDGAANHTYLRVMYLDANNQPVLPNPFYDYVQPADGSAPKDGDWTYYEKIVTVPSGAQTARVEVAYESGTGTLWADEISVIPWVPVDSVKLAPRKGLLGIGADMTVTASFLPADVTNDKLAWSSDNTGVASVSTSLAAPNAAVVHGVSDGLATIRACGEPRSAGAAAPCGTFTVNVGIGTDITAADIAVQLDEDASVIGPIEATDAAGDALTASVFLPPAHGTASIQQDGSWNYYPDADYNGKDAFTLLITDGHGHYGFSAADLVVRPVEDAPVMTKIEVNAGTTQNVVLSSDYTIVSATDADGEALTFGLAPGSASGPAHGTATVQPGGRWSYAPDAGYTGYDRFVIQVSDGHGGTDRTSIAVYVGMPGSELIATLASRHAAPASAHPRLYADADDFDRIRGLVQTDPIMAEWYAKIVSYANSVVNDPPYGYQTTGSGADISILPRAQQIMKRIQTMALMYQITGDPDYAAAGVSQLEAMANPAQFKDWNGGATNFLSISEMGTAAAIGYDWLYDAMTQPQRDALRARIVSEVLLKAKNVFLKGGSLDWWTRSPSNWNVVVNGGLIATALAVADEADANRVDTDAPDPADRLPIAATVLERAISSVQVGLGVFATQGDWPEGTGYWDYTTEYLAFMIGALRDTLGTDFGFMQLPGVAQTPNYMASLHSENGPFNYGDSLTTVIDSPQLLLFADLLGDPSASWFRQYAYAKNKTAEPLDLIWYRPGNFAGAAAPSGLDALYDFPLKNNLATFRDSWNSPSAGFAAIKGGITNYNVTNSKHADLDVGTFVLDALGVRWAVDLGKDDYGLNQYFEFDPAKDPNRWDYYRKRAEGSNTLVINPGDGPDQAIDAVAPIVAYDSKPEGGYAIVDMTSAYKQDAVFAKRGLQFGEHRASYLLQDEVQLKKQSDMYWFMHTEASITLSADHRSAVLEQDGKRLYAQLLTPDGQFEDRPAEPLPSSPHPAVQAQNTKQRKLAIHLPEARGLVTIAVRFTPLSAAEAIPSAAPAVVPLSDWSVDASPVATLSSITLGGVPLQGFAAYKTKYASELPLSVRSAPIVAATAADPSDTVTVTQASGIPGTAIVEVTDDLSIAAPSVYYVDLVRGVTTGILPGVPVLPLAYWRDSGPAGNAWPGVNAADGNPNTYWSVGGAQTIDFDLGSETTADYVGISWVKGNERQFFFDIEASSDGIGWTTIYSGPSSGKVTGDYEIYDIPATTARYLRLSVFGNTKSDITSIVDVMAYGPPSA